MAEVLLFHHAQGSTRDVRVFTDELRAVGAALGLRRVLVDASSGRSPRRSRPAPAPARRARCARRAGPHPGHVPTDRPSPRRWRAGGGTGRRAKIGEGPMIGRTVTSPSCSTVVIDARAAAGQPERRVIALVRADLHQAVGAEVAELADERRRAAPSPCATGVAQDLVAVEPQRVGALGDLDRHVGVVRARMRDAGRSVVAGPRAARPREHVDEHESAAVGTVARRSRSANCRPPRRTGRGPGRPGPAPRSPRP